MNLRILLVSLAVLVAAVVLSQQTNRVENVLRVATVSPQTDQLEMQGELVVYTYDGITAEWGLGPKIFPKFELQCKCKIRVVAKGDVGSFVSQLIFERNDPKADVALGIDNTFKPLVAKEDLLEPYRPENLSEIDPTLFDGDYRFIPFDWGYLAFVYDSEKIAPPKNLEDLTLPKYAKKFVIEDARTSSPGKVFLYWVASEYGMQTKDYLLRLKPNLLTITPGWSEAYNLFLQGEAPMVLSYTTSPAYHIINENTAKYKAAIFPKMYRQIEYVSIVKGAKNKELAHQFMEFMISQEAQAEIPLGNYMYPSRKYMELPEAFKLVEMPKDYGKEIEDGDKWLSIWEEVFSN